MSIKELKKGLMFKPPFISKLKQSMMDSLNIIKWRNGINNIGVNFEIGGTECYTDGCDIYLGTEYPWFNLENTNVKETIIRLQGVIFHEVGHLLYTSFKASEMANKHISNGRFWPYLPKEDSTVVSYIQKSPKHAARIMTSYHRLWNIIEDGRIEYLLLSRQGKYGRFVTGLKLNRATQREVMPSFAEVVERYDNTDENKKPEVKMQEMYALIFQVAKYGFVKDATRDDYKTNPFFIKLMEVTDYIEEAVDSVSAEKLFVNLNEVYSLIFDDYILPFLESIPEDDEEELQPSNQAGTPSGSKSSSAVEKALEKVMKGLGNSHRQTRAGAKKAEKASEKSKAELKDRAEKEKAEVDAAKGSGGSKKESAENKSTDTASNPTGEIADNSSSATGSTHIERTETDSIWGGYGPATILTEEEMSIIEGLDVEAINAIESGEEESYDVDKTLQEPTGIDYGQYNQNLTWRIERVLTSPSSAHESTYSTFAKYVEIGKEAARIIKPYINPTTEHPWEKNQYYGSRFKASRVANPNLRYFNKRTTVARTPSLSVSILIDESGSMSGNKIAIAKATAIALYEMCVELGVPYCVLGHSVRFSNEDVYIRNYCYFDEHEEETKYRLLSIQSGGCNRDGAALRYAAELLNQQNTDRKLLLIISDGQPSAYGYGGTAAEADIREVLREYERFGVSVIAAAIDADKEQIQHIYGAERFLRIDNIETLPDELLSIVKKALF